MAWTRELGWKRFDERGEERAAFACGSDVCGLEGMGAVAINGSGLVFQYRIEYSDEWRVRRAGIVAHLGGDEFTLMLEHDGDSWTVNGVHDQELDGCTDLDLGFTPSTNTAAIKRLGLEVGDEAAVRCVLVQEPELAFVTSEQHYRRVAEDRYEFTAQGFSAEIEVDLDGMVVEYPGMFRALESVATG